MTALLFFDAISSTESAGRSYSDPGRLAILSSAGSFRSPITLAVAAAASAAGHLARVHHETFSCPGPHQERTSAQTRNLLLAPSLATSSSWSPILILRQQLVRSGRVFLAAQALARHCFWPKVGEILAHRWRCSLQPTGANPRWRAGWTFRSQRAPGSRRHPASTLRLSPLEAWWIVCRRRETFRWCPVRGAMHSLFSVSRR